MLTLNDGTELTPAHAVAVNGILWVYLDNGITLADAFALLNDPEKTAVIRMNEYGQESEFDGYTDLFCIRREDDGQVNAGIRKGVVQ